ncbi:MAG: hypothetical protein QM791_08350 [Ferruginibacter sp.]
MKPPSINRIVYLLIAAGLCCLAVKTYFAQADMEDTYTGQAFGWYYKLEFVGNLLISFAAVMSFFLYRRYFPLFVSVCYVSLVLLITLCSLRDITKIINKPNFFFTIRGIGTFINFGLIFFAANTKYFEKTLKVFYGICIFFIIAGIVNLGKVGIGAGRQQYLYAIRDLTVVLIWVFPFFFVQEQKDKRLNMINTAIFFIIFIFVLCTGARTYLIIYVFYLILKFRNQLRSKNGLLVIAATVILAIGGYFFVANSDLSKTLEGAFTNLSERSSEDSRSGQLIEFMRQWEPDYYLQGVGPFKTWYWSGIGDNYYFLDNQFLLMGWWAGLPALFVYIYLLIRAYFTKPEIQLYKDVKGIKLLVGLWILACLGFAIYITISSSLYYFFLDILMGYHLCQFTKIPNFEPEEA